MNEDKNDKRCLSKILPFTWDDSSNLPDIYIVVGSLHNIVHSPIAIAYAVHLLCLELKPYSSLLFPDY